MTKRKPIAWVARERVYYTLWPSRPHWDKALKRFGYADAREGLDDFCLATFQGLTDIRLRIGQCAPVYGIKFNLGPPEKGKP